MSEPIPLAPMRLAVELILAGLRVQVGSVEPAMVPLHARELILANRKLATAQSFEVGPIIARLADVLEPYDIQPALSVDGRSLVLVMPGSRLYPVPR